MRPLQALLLHLSCTDLDTQFRVERAIQTALTWHRQNVHPRDRNLYDAATAYLLDHLNEVAVDADEAAEREEATRAGLGH